MISGTTQLSWSRLRALGGRHVFTYERPSVPRVRVQQGIKVVPLLAGHAEGRVRVMARAQFGDCGGRISDGISDTHLNVCLCRVRMNTGHEDVVPYHGHHAQTLAGPGANGGPRALLLLLLLLLELPLLILALLLGLVLPIALPPAVEAILVADPPSTPRLAEGGS